MAIKNGKPHTSWGGLSGAALEGNVKGALLSGWAEDWGRLGSASESSAAQDLIKVLPPMDGGARAKGLGKRNKPRLVGDTEL